MNIAQNITKIDLEKIGGVVVVEMWEGAWDQESRPSVRETHSNARIETFLAQFESLGFTVEMCDGFHGRALRGKTTRVDIVRILNEWHIRKYPRGWTAKTRPISDKVVTEYEANQAAEWMKANKWTVHEIADGWRGWIGEALPVHDAKTIRRIRRNVNDNLWRGERDSRMLKNLAYDG